MRGMSCPVSASSCGTSSGLNLADTVQTICVLLTDTISMCLWSTQSLDRTFGKISAKFCEYNPSNRVVG